MRYYDKNSLLLFKTIAYNVSNLLIGLAVSVNAGSIVGRRIL